MYVEVGLMALRKPNGDFLPATPIYEEIPDEAMGKSGLTKEDEKACDLFARSMLSNFREYMKLQNKEKKQCKN